MSYDESSEQATKSEQAKKSGRRNCIAKVVFWLVTLLSIPVIVFYLYQFEPSDGHPYIHIDSASVSVQESSWIVGFRIQNLNLFGKFHYEYIRVSVEQGTSSNNSSTTVISPFTQPYRNTTHINSTIVMTSWPDYNARDYIQPGPMMAEYGLIFMSTVKFRSAYTLDGYNYLRDCVCEDVKVGFSTNATTQGVWLGGRRIGPSPILTHNHKQDCHCDTPSTLMSIVERTGLNGVSI